MRYKVNDPESNERSSDGIKIGAEASWPYNEKSSNTKETKLIIVVGLLAVAVIALVATLTIQMAVFRKEEYREMCQSEECINTASRVLDAMNKTVDPCQDFYQFACGGWIDKHPIPQSQAAWDQLAFIREELIQKLRILLEEPDKENDLRPVKLARKLYKNCMDTASVEALGLKPIFSILNSIGLPSQIPTDNNTEITDIAELVGKAQRIIGLNMLVNFYISEDVRNTSINRMTMEQVSPGISERYLLNEKRFETELTEYKKYVTAMLELSGTGEKSSELANEILDFSTQIAKIMATQEERRSENHFFHDVKIDELQQLTDLHAHKWNWTSYMNAVFNNTNVTIQTNVDGVIIMDLFYLQKLPRLLSETPPGTIARFLWWNIYSTVAPLTLQKFRDLGFQFSQRVFGLKEKTPRWKGCTGNVNANFGMALSYIYVQKYFNDQARDKALEMLMDIKTAFDEMVSESKWMDKTTKERAHKKLQAIRPFVAFPEWIKTPEKLNELYEGVDIIPGKLFDTFLKLTDREIKKTLNSLRKEPNKDRWITSSTTVNAFYSAILNSVTFPAGILSPPFYGNGLESMNYGAIGAIMGHELTHGFDNQGRRYDENGNLRQWWSDETLQHYHKKVECIIKQYSNYHLPELGNNFTVNGENTQGENIADNGGIREAFRAYQRLKTRNPNQQGLPGLVEYSHDQLFFLGFAQTWCGNYTNGALKSKLVEGVHAPNHFRVIGTLSNNVDFANAWKCPEGSPMNPPDKCILW